MVHCQWTAVFWEWKTSIIFGVGRSRNNNALFKKGNLIPPIEVFSHNKIKQRIYTNQNYDSFRNKEKVF